MGLPLALHERVTFDPPFSSGEAEGGRFYHGSTNRLIEVTRIDAERDLGHVLDRLVSTLQDDFAYPNSAAFDVATAVSEVGQNVFHHNDRQSGCKTTSAFVAMQEFQPGPDAFLEIGVADGGTGLLASLRRGSTIASISDDVDAILQAAKLGVSRFDDATRGQGLARLLEKVATHRGSVQIRSGRGVVRYRADRSQGRAFPVPLLPGVQIALTLPALSSQNGA